MKKGVSFLLCLMAVCAGYGVSISDVKVSQRWPWNTKMNIDFRLSGCENGKKYDIDVEMAVGNEKLNLSGASVSGDRFSLTNGTWRIVWDPSSTEYTNRVALADFVVSLTPVDSSSRLYLIIDMSKGAQNNKESELWPISYTNEIADADGDGEWDREYKLTKMVFRRIEPGTFAMGVPATEVGTWGNNSDKSEKLHNVTISKVFYMGVFPVTSQQFYQIKAYRANTKYGKSEATGARPASDFSYESLRGKVSDGIDWPSTGHKVHDDPSITIFSNVNGTSANNLSMLAWFRRHVPGLIVDLPTEAQWEYCCRAGTSPDSFYNGVNITSANKSDLDVGIDSIARTRHNSYFYENGEWTDPKVDGTVYGTCDVGSYQPNAWGLYDMHGNVNEWCLDWYANAALPDETDPKGVTSGTSRIYRGGGYSNAPSDCRAGFRGAANPNSGWGNCHFGYRLAIHIQ